MWRCFLFVYLVFLLHIQPAGAIDKGVLGLDELTFYNAIKDRDAVIKFDTKWKTSQMVRLCT